MRLVLVLGGSVYMYTWEHVPLGNIGSLEEEKEMGSIYGNVLALLTVKL